MSKLYDVVLADDEPSVLRRLGRLEAWQANGFRIAAETADGEDALAAVERFRPDLVLTDIRMPVTDGIEVARNLAQYDPPPAVVFLSGYSDFEYARAAVQNNVFDYLLKPVDPEELHAVLKKLRIFLDRRQARSRMLSQGLRTVAAQWIDILFYDNRKEDPPKPLTEATAGHAFLFGLALGEQAKLSLSQTDSNDTRLFFGSRRTATQPFFLSFPPADDTAGYREALTAQNDGEPGVTSTPARIILGPRIEHLHNLFRSCADTARQWEEWFYASVIRYSGIPDTTRVENAVDGKTLQRGCRTCENRMLEAIRNHDSEAMHQAITQLCGYLRQQRPSPETCLRLLNGVRDAALRENDRDLPHPAAPAATQPATLEQAALNLKAVCTAVLAETTSQARLQSESLHEWIRSYLEIHYAEPVTLRKLARISGMNPVYLGQRFHKESGISFHDLLLRIRMRKAAELLETTNTSVNGIAELTGYRSTTNFYKGFKQIYKESPNQYRIRLQSQKEMQ